MQDDKVEPISGSVGNARGPEKEAAGLRDNAPEQRLEDQYSGHWDNPKDWPSRKKWLVTSILSITGFNRIMVSTIMAPALPAISADLNLSSVKSVMALSVFLIAAAFGPLVIGPLSEIYGRRPVMHATSLWFLIWNIVCGFANSGGLLIAARLLAGFGASAIYALAAGVLSDVWRPEQRGISLTLYLLVPLLGAAVGPILGGYITDRLSWHWLFWSTSIVQGTLSALSLPIFHETYAPVLRRQALRARLAAQDSSVPQPSSPDSLRLTLARSLALPLRLLATHPIIQLISILSSVNYGILYILLSTVASTYTIQYNASLTSSGLHYLALCIGEIIGSLIGGPFMDFAYARLKARTRTQEGRAEFRVPNLLPGALLAPAGLLLYGWAAEYKLPWPVVDLGLVIVALGLQIGGQATQAYVMDSYLELAGSASGASQLLRGLAAAGFPLFAPELYGALGYGWGSSLLGLVFVGVAVPVPAALWVWGKKWRGEAVVRVGLVEG